MVVEVLVFAGIRNRGTVDLGELVAQQVYLAEAGPGIAAEFGEADVDGPEVVDQLLQQLGVDITEVVEGGPLDTDPQQRLVGMLAMQVDEPAAQLAEGTDSGEMPVDVSPGPAVCGNDAADHHLVVTGDESALDLGLLRSGPHQRRVGPASGEQVDGPDHQRLARARLTGDGSHAAVQDKRQLTDHAKVANSQFGQHKSPHPARRPHLRALSGH